MHPTKRKTPARRSGRDLAGVGVPVSGSFPTVLYGLPDRGTLVPHYDSATIGVALLRLAYLLRVQTQGSQAPFDASWLAVKAGCLIVLGQLWGRFDCFVVFQLSAPQPRRRISSSEPIWTGTEVIGDDPRRNPTCSASTRREISLSWFRSSWPTSLPIRQQLSASVRVPTTGGSVVVGFT